MAAVDEKLEQEIAASFRDAAYKVVTLSDGRRIKIQRVTRSMLATVGEDSPLIGTLRAFEKLAAGDLSEQELAKATADSSRLQQVIVRMGLVAPHLDAPGQVGVNGSVPYSAIGHLEQEIYDAIMAFSGRDEEAAQAARFPDRDEAGEAVPAPLPVDGKKAARRPARRNR